MRLNWLSSTGNAEVIPRFATFLHPAPLVRIVLNNKTSRIHRFALLAAVQDRSSMLVLISQQKFVPPSRDIPLLVFDNYYCRGNCHGLKP